MSREAYRLAVGFFLDTVAAIKPDQWEDDALGVWNVRNLVGHTARSMTNVEQYATVGAGGRTGIGSDDDIAQRGREAGRQLGENPATAVRGIAERVLPLIDSLADDYQLETAVGRVTLIDYLPSRIQELTTHSLDLAKAIGRNATPPEECLRVSLYWYADQAIRRGRGGGGGDGVDGPPAAAGGVKRFWVRWGSPSTSSGRTG